MEVLQKIHEHEKIKSIGFNIDYTPFAKERDSEIVEWSKSKKIKIIAEEDYVLHPLSKN